MIPVTLHQFSGLEWKGLQDGHEVLTELMIELLKTRGLDEKGQSHNVVPVQFVWQTGKSNYNNFNNCINNVHYYILHNSPFGLSVSVPEQQNGRVELPLIFSNKVSLIIRLSLRACIPELISATFPTIVYLK